MDKLTTILDIKNICLKNNLPSREYIQCPMSETSWFTFKVVNIITAPCIKCPVYLNKNDSNTCPINSGWLNAHDNILHDINKQMNPKYVNIPLNLIELL